MFARSAASPARRGAGYVCLACRHERVLHQRQQRWNSDLAANKTSAAERAEVADAPEDWLMGLNSLSDEFGDKKRARKAVGKGSGEAKVSGRHGGEDEPKSGKVSSMEELRGSLSAATGQVERTAVEVEAGAEQDGAASRRRETPRPRTRAALRERRRRLASAPPTDMNSLLENLRHKNDGQASSVPSTPGQRPPRSDVANEEKRATQIRSKSTSPTAKRPPTLIDTEASKRALMAELSERIPVEIDQMEAEHNARHEEQYEDYLAQSNSFPVSEPEVKSKEPVPVPSFLSKDPSDAPASSSGGFFSSTLNFFKKKVGLAPSSRPEDPKNVTSSNPADQKDGEANKQTPPAKYATPATKKKHDVESTFKDLRLRRETAPQRSPVERYEESSTRAPWGTTPLAPSPPDKRVASFEDIASADRVSVKKPISTRFTKRPFGGEPTNNTIAGLKEQLQSDISKGDAASVVEAPADDKAEVAASTHIAHSRLSDLYAARTGADASAPVEPSPDTDDTHDLAYLRRQYNQDRVKEEVEFSIRKNFSGVSIRGPELERAIQEEARRSLEGKTRAAQKERATSDDLVASGSPVEGVSLGAAMRSGAKPSAEPSNVASTTKRKVGRPRKEPAAPRAKPRHTEKDDSSDESAPLPTQQSEPAASPEAVVESEPSETSAEELKSLTPSKLKITPLDIPQPPVPFLQYGLDRVLFNPGVYQLQDEASRVYNFDPYLQNIMPNAEFDFDSLKEYKTSSKDVALANIAKEHGNKYIGSTSSMTSALGHFHYLISNWRPLNVNMLSHKFVLACAKGGAGPILPTQINRAPSAIFLRWKNGTYAIDADKEHDSANVLMLLGKSMELLLTLPKSDFERYRKSDPRKVPEEQRTAPESYQYTTMRDFLMRSQLDAYDPRLPNNGTFDLKTRAVVSVRHAADDHEPMTGYEIYGQQGKWHSYEKEYFDMMRSTMLKYMLQARMGRMNGIFVAYHNVERMFGFQYIPISEMDLALHGQTDPSLGDQEFRASLDMLNEVLNAATKKFPEQSLRIHFETKPEEGEGGMPTAMHIFAEPMSEEECDKIQDSQKAKIAEFERTVMGKANAATVDGAEGEAQNVELSADEAKSSGISVEVEQDVAAEGLEDEPVVLAEEDDASVAALDDATAYARSLVDFGDAESVEEEFIEKSTSHADPQFLNKLETSDSDDTRPLFYATIIAQSRVNGFVPPSERPQDLKSKDEWQIDYILKEYDIGRHQWSLYEDLKARRRHAFVKEEEEEGVDKKGDGYIALLRKFSEQGRALRKQKDLKDAGLPIVRVEDLDLERLDQVESVEDYMKFLERPKVDGTREMFG